MVNCIAVSSYAGLYHPNPLHHFLLSHGIYHIDNMHCTVRVTIICCGPHLGFWNVMSPMILVTMVTVNAIVEARLASYH